MPKHVQARTAQDEQEERQVRKLARSHHAPADWKVHAKTGHRELGRQDAHADRSRTGLPLENSALVLRSKRPCHMFPGEQATRVTTAQLNRRAKPWIWGRPPKDHRHYRRLFSYCL
jgi:hypothetical protein